MNEYLFEIKTPLNVTIHTSRNYWDKLVIKHPELENRLSDVKQTLERPTEIRKSKRDEFIFLHYSERLQYWLCVVTKQSGLDGFIVTAYITDRIKEGEIVWPK
jgi:hypothetical protein